MNIEIYPLDKIVIDKTSVCLGMKRQEVEALIGKGQLIGNRYYYYNSDMAIDYSKDQTIEFIEFLGGIDGSLKPVIYGVSVFDTPADELINILKQHNNGRINDIERGYCFTFSSISVGVYREITPSDVAEMIEEMRADGISIDNNKDVENEIKKASHWATVGIGVAGYY